MRMKKGYFNKKQFYNYIVNILIPTLREIYSMRTLIIIMDNVGIYCNERIHIMIEAAGYLVWYLPPYSPDFNPIELTFSVLKLWIRCWYYLK